MFVQIKLQILISKNVLVKWKNINLKLFQLQKMFQKLLFQ